MIDVFIVTSIGTHIGRYIPPPAGSREGHATAKSRSGERSRQRAAPRRRRRQRAPGRSLPDPATRSAAFARKRPGATTEDSSVVRFSAALQSRAPPGRRKRPIVARSQERATVGLFRSCQGETMEYVIFWLTNFGIAFVISILAWAGFRFLQRLWRTSLYKAIPEGLRNCVGFSLMFVAIQALLPLLFERLHP